QRLAGCRRNITGGICRKPVGNGFEVPSLTDFRNRLSKLVPLCGGWHHADNLSMRWKRGGLVSGLELGNGKGNVRVLVGGGQLCRGGFCLGAGLIDDDVPVIASVGLARTRHVQVTDEYVENVTHAHVYASSHRSLSGRMSVGV